MNIDARLRKLEQELAERKRARRTRRPSVIEVYVVDRDGSSRKMEEISTAWPRAKPSSDRVQPEVKLEDPEDDEAGVESPAPTNEPPASRLPQARKPIQPQLGTANDSSAPRPNERFRPTGDDPANWWRDD